MPRKTHRNGTLASAADRYTLYLASVQAPSHEVGFFQRVFKREFGRPAHVLREDFCGTAAVCYEWVKGDANRRAIGVDLDPEPLQWGREHLAADLSESARARVTLLQDDVRAISGAKADILAAQNFSFWIFKTRPELLAYLRAARRNLKREGMMVLDMMGGSEAHTEDREERRRVKNFTYVWEQERFCPITHDCRYHISFRFRDGSELRRAFTYDWRHWTIPEVREALLEAGFSRVDVYWEGTDRATGKGNDVYAVRKTAEPDPGWIAYLVAVK